MSKLKKVPELLAEFNATIAEQLDAGIIYKVGNMDSAEKTSHLPHSVVIREESETTKVRIVLMPLARKSQ